MTLFKILGQAFGILGLIGIFVQMQAKKREWIYAIAFVVNIIFALNIVFLEGFCSGVFINLLASVQLAFGWLHEKRGNESGILEKIIFTVVYLAIGIYGYHSYMDIFAIVASMFYMVAVFQKNPQFFRLFSIFNMSTWVVYHLLIGSSGMFAQFVGITSAIIGMVRFKKQKKQKIKAVLFDLDGTLVNSISDLAACVNHVLKNNGMPTRAENEFFMFVGDGIPKMIERALPADKRSKEMLDKLVMEFLVYYANHYADNTIAYDGIKATINALREERYKLIVISNKAQEMAEKVVLKIFGEVFDEIVGKREGYPAKPDPTLTFEILKKHGLEPNECVFLGDSGMDMALGVNSGAYPIGVLWGFRSKEELLENGAKSIIASPQELLEILKEM